MLKKSVKYFFIVFGNLFVLTVMLAIWTDDFELTFNTYVRPLEILQLFGITLLLLILLRITVSIFRRYKINSLRKRIKVSIIITLLVSSFYYISYGYHIYLNRIANADIRARVLKKLDTSSISFNDYSIKNLTAEEYSEIARKTWFPKLPHDAENINLSYYYDGFLPDYTFFLEYYVPRNPKLETINYKDETFSKTQTVEKVGERFKVNYSERLW